MSPYRTAELTAPETFPLWQRALAWWFSPEFGAQFRFYRRLRRGRWSYAPYLGAIHVGWHRVQECPAEWHRFTDEQLQSMNALDRYSARAQNIEGDEHRKCCACEVWQ